MTGAKPDGSGVGGHLWVTAPGLGAVLSAAAALSHSSHLGKPDSPGDGENIQPRVLIMCYGCRSQEG